MVEEKPQQRGKSPKLKKFPFHKAASEMQEWLWMM
jgi:hypothetical protein